jgi:hypothetical protein
MKFSKNPRKYIYIIAFIFEKNMQKDKLATEYMKP